MGNFQVAFSGLVQGRSLQHMGWKVWASDSPAAPSGQPRRSAGSTGSAGSRDPVSAPGLPKGLVETCFAPSKMPPKSGYCCSAVAQWQTPPPFFFSWWKQGLWENFHGGCHWHAGTPPAPGRAAGRALLCGAHKEGRSWRTCSGKAAIGGERLRVPQLHRCPRWPGVGCLCWGSSHGSGARGCSAGQGRGPLLKHEPADVPLPQHCSTEKAVPRGCRAVSGTACPPREGAHPGEGGPGSQGKACCWEWFQRLQHGAGLWGSRDYHGMSSSAPPCSRFPSRRCVRKWVWI